MRFVPEESCQYACPNASDQDEKDYDKEDSSYPGGEKWYDSTCDSSQNGLHFVYSKWIKGQWISIG